MNQYTLLNENITDDGALQISVAADSIDLGFIKNPKNSRVQGLNEVSLDRTYSFFNIPKTIVKEASFYLLCSDLDLKTTEKDYGDMIKGMPALYCLILLNSLPTCIFCSES